MFRIDVLQQRFDELSQREAEYWRALRTDVESLRRGFSNYLASDDRENHHKETQPKVSAGTIADDLSIFTDTENLPKVGSQLHFTLILNLMEQRLYQPERLITFNLSIERKDNARLVVIDLESSKEIDTSRGLMTVYEHLYTRSKEKLSGS